MRFYQERLEKHKDFLRDQKFALLKEINKLQNKLHLIESSLKEVFMIKFFADPKNLAELFTGLNLIPMKETNTEQEASHENQINSRIFDQNSEKNENYEK